MGATCLLEPVLALLRQLGVLFQHGQLRQRPPARGPAPTPRNASRVHQHQRRHAQPAAPARARPYPSSASRTCLPISPSCSMWFRLDGPRDPPSGAAAKVSDSGRASPTHGSRRAYSSFSVALRRWTDGGDTKVTCGAHSTGRTSAAS